MIESLFKQRSTLARLRSGPLAQYLPFIAGALHEEHYAPETVRRYVRVADGLGRWLCKQGLRITQIDETTLARYRASTGRRQKGQLHAAGRGLAKVLILLRMQHAVDEPVNVAQRRGHAVNRLRLPPSGCCWAIAWYAFPVFALRNVVCEDGVRHGPIQYRKGYAASDH